MQPGKQQRITVGRESWIGAGSIVLADVGDQSIIGAGSIVTKPTATQTISVGNPARPIAKRGLSSKVQLHGAAPSETVTHVDEVRTDRQAPSP